MGAASETKLIIKRTFLEYVEISPARKDSRLRAQTDSALVSGLDGQDMRHPDTAHISVGNVCAFNMCGETPEVLSAEISLPVGQTSWTWELDPWFPGSCQPLVHCCEASSWVPCVVPADSTISYQVPVICSVGVEQSPPCGSMVSNSIGLRSHAETNPGARSSAVLDPAISVGDDYNTTVMLRNLPNDYTREMLLELVEAQGFAGTYDFVYLPIDFNSQAGLGYAFVNLLCPVEAQRFWKQFDGFSGWSLPSDKVCSLNWSSPHQGLASHVDRYRNSPVMHNTVPDEYKPIIIFDGVRVPFPPPSKQLKAPRLRVRDSAQGLFS